MADSIRVLIVDDSAFVRRAVERMLAPAPGIRIVGTASNGREAIEQARTLHPDVIVLDVNMPEMDGLEALRHIMAEAPTSVVMLSTLTREWAETTLAALDYGAVDFLDKSSAGTTMDIYALAPALREKVLAAAGAAVTPIEREEEEEEVPAPLREAAASEAPATAASRYEVVVIGASTGGPRALTELIGSLPASFPTGIVVAQHMPPGFTKTLAERLDQRTPFEVREATQEMRVQPGRVILAPGGQQITLAHEGESVCVHVDAGPSNLLHRPSVDLLFQSTAEVVGDRAVGVVLTGMGDDGARGLRSLRQTGARTIAESERTAVIYGMPRAAAEAAEWILDLKAIAGVLVEIVRPRDEEAG